jgi:hypothetical protein
MLHGGSTSFIRVKKTRRYFDSSQCKAMPQIKKLHVKNQIANVDHESWYLSSNPFCHKSHSLYHSKTGRWIRREEQTMTYAKRKAARPANAATTTEPWIADAPLVSYPDGDAGAVGAVTLWGIEMVPVDPAGELVGAGGLGVTVMVE